MTWSVYAEFDRLVGEYPSLDDLRSAHPGEWTYDTATGRWYGPQNIEAVQADTRLHSDDPIAETNGTT